MAKKAKVVKEKSIEDKIWESANKLRGNLNASEYQNVNSVKAADVDGNNAVDVQDATLIQRYLAEYEVEYSIGESI